MPQPASAQPLRQRLLASLRQAGTRGGLVLLTVVLLAWLWGVMLWLNARQKEQLVADRAGELALMAGAVSQHTSATLRGAESDLRSLDLWLLTHPEADPLREPNFLRFAAELRRAAKGLVDYRLVSDDGLTHELPPRPDRQPADVRDRDYVLAHGADISCVERCPVYIGATVLSRVNGTWVVPLSMRLSSPAPARAASAGGPSATTPAAAAAAVTSTSTSTSPSMSTPRMRLLVAVVALDLLAGEHERLRSGSDGTIVLIRGDGTVLARTPALPGLVGSNISRSPLFQAEYGRKARGSFVSPGLVSDHVQRLVSYEQLRDYPVTAMVSRSTDEIAATHARRVRTPFIASAVLSVLLLAFTVFLQRLRGSQQTLRKQQEHLRRLATTDELTGVMNRRAFLEAATREFERAQRYRRPTVLLALDIDHFKRINDTHGHAGGDLALRMCAARWLPALREHDLLGRVGGEEFCVLLPETSEAHATLIAERLRAITEATPVMAAVRVSVSIGWASLSAGDDGLARLMERADQALYQAKHNGRNRVWPHPLTASGAAQTPQTPQTPQMPQTTTPTLLAASATAPTAASPPPLPPSSQPTLPLRPLQALEPLQPIQPIQQPIQPTHPQRTATLPHAHPARGSAAP